MTISLVGERGQITIPKAIRQRLGIKPKSVVILEEREGGILIRPAATIPIRALTEEELSGMR
jgi:AbrB family looped-hinge helix DNA binding protein